MKKKINIDNMLSKFSEGIIKNKWIVIAVFAVLLIASAIGSGFVKKESDVISYLDKDSATIQGLETLQDEFDIIGDFSIGISYVSEEQARELVNSISNCNNKEYINKIVWVGTFDNISNLGTVVGTGKAEIIANQLKNKFVISTENDDGTYVDTYLINIYFVTPNSADETSATIDEIEQIIEKYFGEKISEGTLQTTGLSVSDCYCFTGSASNSRYLLKSSIGDMPKFVIAAVIAVFFILLLTTRSYLEPLIFLATLGISILLNMGTNIIAGQPIGKISSITASCATILQLAVAMDYAIFLMHTYYEELRTTPNSKVAMIQALPKTIVSVVASSLTTVGGFVALFFMKFGIGYDLGFVLAKGVVLSLITVICLQPIIILLADKLIHKTEHKWSITPRLKFVSKHITKKVVAIPIIVLCVAILIPSCFLQSKVDLTYLTVNEENENPNLPEEVMTATSNQLIVLTPYKYEKNIDSLNGYESQYDFINQVYRIGYKTEDTFDTSYKYYSQDQNGKMVLTSFTNEKAFKNYKDAHTVYKFDGTSYIEINEYYSNVEYYEKQGDSYVKYEPASQSAFDMYTKANPVYVVDSSYSRVSDIFSVCTILDKYDLKTVERNPLFRDAVYKQLMTNFVSNATYVNDKKQRVPLDDPEQLHYILYTMTIDGPKEDTSSYNTVLAIQNIAKSTFEETGAEIKMTGNVVGAKELSEVTPTDYKIVSILSVAIIFLILLFTFKSPLLAVILVMVIETGIWANLTVTYLMGVKLHFMAYLIVTAIALGATVDYAILLTSKYLEEKKNGMTGQAAIKNAVYRAAPGVLTSGSIFFVACLAVQLISTNIIVKQITALLARNAAISVFLVFSFLPSILSIKERITRAISIKRGKGDPDEGKSTESIYAVSSKHLKDFAIETGNLDALAAVEDKEEYPIIDDVPVDSIVDEKKDDSQVEPFESSDDTKSE